MAKSIQELLAEYRQVRDAQAPGRGKQSGKVFRGPTKRRNTVYKDAIYRYHDGARPGDEFRAMPDPRNPFRLTTLPEEEYPGPGDVRYEYDHENNRILRLHDGAPSPITGNLGWSSKELEAQFLNFGRRQEAQDAQYERRQRGQQTRYREMLRKQQAAQEAMTPQERQTDLFENLDIPGAGATGEIAKFLAGQASDEKNVLSRIMDIAQRGLYTATNVADSHLERNADKYKSGDRWQIMSALGDLGQDIGSLSPTAPINEENVERKTRVAREAWEGFSGRDKVFTSDLLQKHFDVENGGVLFTAGLAGDILLDPATYLSGGTTALGRVAARTGIKAAEAASRATGRAADLSQTGLARWSRNETRAPVRQPTVLHDGPLTPNSLDEIIRTDLPTTEKIRRVDELVTAYVRPTAQGRARELFGAQLQRLRDEGKVTDDELTRLVSSHGTRQLDEAISAATRPRQAAPEPPSGQLAPGAGGLADEAPAASPAAAARRLAEDTRLAAQASAQRTRAARAAAIERAKPVLKGTEVVDPKITLKPVAGPIPSRLRATAASARAKFRDSKTPAGRTFVAQEHVTKVALDGVNQVGRMIRSGRGSANRIFPKLDALTRLAEPSWAPAFVRTFGKGSQPVEHEIEQIVRDYIDEVGQRPSAQAAAQSDEVGDQAYKDSLAWHAGLYSAVANHFEGRVLDSLGDEILREITSTGDTALFDELLQHAAPSGTKTLEDSVTEAVSPETAEAFADASQRFNRETPEAIKELADKSTRIAEQLEDNIKTQMYELIAQSDYLPLPNGLKLEITPDGRLNAEGIGDWDEYMAWRTEVQVPAMAAKSYNNTFGKLFSASYGQSGALDDLKRRMLGNANARVAYERDLLTKSPLARLSRGTRKRQFRDYRPGKPTTPEMQWMDQEIGRILDPYLNTDQFGTAFGLAGQPNVGDLNRWLSRSPFDFQLVETTRGAKRFTKDVTQAVPKDTDPLEFLFQLSVANEKVLVEKATLNAIADTFGVRNIDTLATRALRDRGYVTNGVFGNQVLFHPEISRQVERLHELTSRADALHPAIENFQKVQNIWKRLVTVYNIPGFHVRNIIGDSFKNYIVSGVSPRSSVQAASLMRSSGAMDPDIVRLLQSPGKSTEDALAEIGDVNRNFIKMKDDTYLSIEEVYAEYIRGGLSGTQISTQMGILERTPGVNVFRKAVTNPAEKLADATSQFARLSLFVDQLKKGKGSREEVFQRAVEEVRKVHYDYGHMTHFERAVMSTVIPFYRFLRNNYPFMASVLFTKPGRATIPDKVMRNFSESQGFEHNEGMPYAGFVAPDWVTDRRLWPVVQTDDGVIFANPDYELNAMLRDFGAGDPNEAAVNHIQNNASPAIPAIFQALSGQELAFGEIQDAETGRNPLENFINTFPQYRSYMDLTEDKEYDDPGRWGQIAGLGSTRTVTADDAIATAFYDIPGVQEASDRRRRGSARRKEEYERKGNEIESRRSNTDVLLEMIRSESAG